MTTFEPPEQGRTAPIEVLPASPSTNPPGAGHDAVEAAIVTAHEAERTPVASTRDVMTYVPLAVTLGDGFKFGCGFFLAAVVALLIGFVVLAALFVLTSVFGVSLPLSR